MKAKTQVFLSYVREDEERVQNLYQKLSDAGFKPWMHKKDLLPGERRESSIQKAIQRSDFFLVCLSANSVNKRGSLQREIKRALYIWQEMLEGDIYLIPVRLEYCELPEILFDLQCVNLFEEDGWPCLVKALQVGLERREVLLVQREMVSPYITSGPVSGADFYGRRELVAEIIGGRQRAFYVLGARQVGKTSLLHQIDTLVPALRCDVQWAAGHLSDLVRQAQLELEDKQERFRWLPAPETVPDDDLFALLREINRAAAEAGQILWLLVDEAEGMLSIARDDPSVLHRLRGTAQNCRNLRTVLVAAKTLNEANDLVAASGSPFLSGFALRYLGGLSDEAAIALLRQSQSDTPVKVDDALATRLVSLTNGHPLLLQLLGERLFTAGCLRPPTDEDLVIIDDKMARSDTFSEDFVHLSGGERVILRAFFDSGRATGDQLGTIAYRGFLPGLTQLGYLHSEGDSYTIGNAFFARWLSKWADWESESDVSDESTQAVYEQSRLEQVLALVEEDRLSLAEIRRTLDAIRRTMIAWQRHGLPAEGTRRTMEKIEAALASRGGPKHKLEATLPLLPPVLAYKVEWGGEIARHLDKLRATLDELEDRFPGEEPDDPQE